MAIVPQAYMVLIAALVMGTVLLMPSNIRIYDPDTENIVAVPYNWRERLMMVFFLSLPMIVHIYSVNCLVTGSCNMFAWIVSALIVLWIVSFLVIAFMA